MKIALMNVIKPQEGSRDGMTEYAYQLYERLKRRHHVDLIYVTEKSKRLDTAAFLYANTLFKAKAKRLGRRNYDIVHITNQELGFVAKILKKGSGSAKVITSVHDLMRMHQGAYKNIVQRAYSTIVSNSILDCFRYSDHIIFTASTVQKEAERKFGGKHSNWITTLLGPSEEFRSTSIPRRTKRKKFVIGYVGAFAPWKNPMFVLRTAKLFERNDKYEFHMYGAGPEESVMQAYKAENRLNNVEIHGFPTQDKFLGMYDGFDALFYPTTEEGSSLPMINAQCRGLPVVIYKKNKVDPEVTRYCFVSEDESEAARIIKRLCERGFDRKRRNEMLRHIRKFSWDRVTKETLKVYGETLKAKRE